MLTFPWQSNGNKKGHVQKAFGTRRCWSRKHFLHFVLLQQKIVLFARYICFYIAMQMQVKRIVGPSCPSFRASIHPSVRMPVFVNYWTDLTRKVTFWPEDPAVLFVSQNITSLPGYKYNWFHRFRVTRSSLLPAYFFYQHIFYWCRCCHLSTELACKNAWCTPEWIPFITIFGLYFTKFKKMSNES